MKKYVRVINNLIQGTVGNIKGKIYYTYSNLHVEDSTCYNEGIGSGVYIPGEDRIASTRKAYCQNNGIKIKPRMKSFKSKITKRATFYSKGNIKVYYELKDIFIPLSFYDTLSTTLEPTDKAFVWRLDTIPQGLLDIQIEDNISKANTIILDWKIIKQIYNCKQIFYWNDKNKIFTPIPKTKFSEVYSNININQTQVKYLRLIEQYYKDPKYKLILNKDFIKDFNKDLTVIDKKMYDNLCLMFESKSDSDTKLAKQIILSSNYDKSKFYLLKLFYEYSRDLGGPDIRAVKKYFEISNMIFTTQDWKLFVNKIKTEFTDENDKNLLKAWIVENLKRDTEKYFELESVKINL